MGARRESAAFRKWLERRRREIDALSLEAETSLGRTIDEILFDKAPDEREFELTPEEKRLLAPALSLPDEQSGGLEQRDRRLSSTAFRMKHLAGELESALRRGDLYASAWLGLNLGLIWGESALHLYLREQGANATKNGRQLKSDLEVCKLLISDLARYPTTTFTESCKRVSVDPDARERMPRQSRRRPSAEPGGKPGDQVKCYRCKRKYPRPDPRMQNQPQCCPNCGTKPPSLWPFSEKAIRTAGAAVNWTKTSRLRGELLAAFEQGSVEQFLHGLGVADPQTPTIGAQPTSSAADLDRWLEIRRQANARADLVLAPNLARGKR